MPRNGDLPGDPMQSLMNEMNMRKRGGKSAMYGPKGMIGPPGSMPQKMVVSQNTAGISKMIPQFEMFKESQRVKAEEKANKMREVMKPKKGSDSTEYYKQQAREQRKRRGMD